MKTLDSFGKEIPKFMFNLTEKVFHTQIIWNWKKNIKYSKN